ncbi:hypothetical protein CPB86DRAFT_585476 [Serendipita vermifera]|nr:hypothetical protein CPB86DRAFT_585476 [Serendipita vermifera]
MWMNSTRIRTSRTRESDRHRHGSRPPKKMDRSACMVDLEEILVPLTTMEVSHLRTIYCSQRVERPRSLVSDCPSHSTNSSRSSRPNNSPVSPHTSTSPLNNKNSSRSKQLNSKNSSCTSDSASNSPPCKIRYVIIRTG